MPSADWMQGALLHLEVERTNACGDTLSSRSFILRAPTPVINTRQDEEIRHEEVHLLKGRAYVSFPINRSEVREDFRNNLVELERLRHTIDSVSATPGIDIVQIQLKGFASPEGSYANNDRLARERTSSLTRYIIEHTNISPMLFHTAYEPEDWQGLRAFVDTTTMVTNRQALLDIIDSDREPDDKLAYLQKSFPDDYAKLKLKAFPLLRHTDYQIDYVQTNVTSIAGAVYTDTIYRLQPDTLFAETMETLTHEPYSTFRPLLAVKTNVLFDALLAPNIEVEVPFGRDLCWSAMAEVWFPWWRWGYNAAGKNNQYYRKDQRPTTTSYQLLTIGVELRRWLFRGCADAHPLLTGPFVGFYAAGGKYDLGRHGRGDQGEFTSIGFSAGYVWPIGSHWNLELSAAIGFVGGPKVHYENEFDDTRLIYRSHNNHWQYAGPTKLKLSLVYLVGKKKGGAR
jgi:hypothetical protein